MPLSWWMCGGSEAGVAAGCGRRTAPVWRLLFSLSVGVEESGRSGAERRTGTRTHTAPRPQETGRQAGAERHGAVRAAGRQGPAPQKPLTDLFIYGNCELFPTWSLQAAGCWPHSSSSSASKVRQPQFMFSTHVTQQRFSTCFLKTVWFSTCANLKVVAQQLQVCWGVSRVRNKPKQPPRRLCLCLFVRIRNLFARFYFQNRTCSA